MSTTATPTAAVREMEGRVHSFRETGAVSVKGMTDNEVIDLIKQIGGPIDEFTVIDNVLRPSKGLLVDHPCAIPRERVLATDGIACRVCGKSAPVHHATREVFAAA